jgi:hypothetical protein
LANGPELRIVNVHYGEIEIWMVKEVEEARTYRELRAFPLRNAKALLDCKIGIEVAGAAVLVAGRVPIRSDRVCKLGSCRAPSARCRNRLGLLLTGQ